MRPQFIELSGEINDYMKVHTVNLVEEGLTKLKSTLKNSTIGILGVAYKKDINDLSERGAKVKVYDPFIPAIAVSAGSVKSEKSAEALFIGSDAVIIVTDHTEFKKLNYDRLIKKMHTKLIVDTRNMLAKYTNNDLLYLKI